MSTFNNPFSTTIDAQQFFFYPKVEFSKCAITSVFDVLGEERFIISDKEHENFEYFEPSEADKYFDSHFNIRQEYKQWMTLSGSLFDEVHKYIEPFEVDYYLDFLFDNSRKS